MKRRGVQAQRKFAQGVYIPPPASNHNTNIDKATNLTIHKDSELRSNIFHSNSSAKGLLDLISFQNIHKHREPIVLLERLRHYPDPNQASSSEALQQYNRSHIKKITTALKHNMCLRSKKKFVKRLRRKNISIAKNKRQPKVNKDLSSLESVDSCNEDDKPLVYLAKEDKKNKSVDKTMNPIPLKEKPKKVTFGVDSCGSGGTNTCETKHRIDQRCDPRLHGAQQSKDDTLKRRSIVHTRSHRRNAADASGSEHETIPLPVSNAPHRLRSILKKDKMKRQSLRTRSSRRTTVDIYESDEEELHENEESSSSNSVLKTDEIRKIGSRRRRLDLSTDDAESEQDEPKTEQTPDRLVQNTDTEMRDAVQENKHKVDSQPSSSKDLINTAVNSLLGTKSVPKTAASPPRLTKKRPSNSTIEYLVQTVPGIHPIIEMELLSNSSDSSLFEITQVKSTVEAKHEILKNSDLDVVSITSSSEVMSQDERKVPPVSEAPSVVECDVKKPSIDKYLNVPLITRRIRNIPYEKAYKINQEKRITKKRTSGSTDQSETNDDISMKIENRRVHCPSKNYSTMNEVVFADPKDLTGRCERCDYCSFIDKVQCVSNMFKIQYCRKIIQSKIYGFDAEDTDSVKNNGSSIPRQKNRQEDTKDLSECDIQTCYLIYDKDSDHIVELKKTQYPNQLTEIKSANIIPRTVNTKIMTVTAFENDKLLDDIINFVLSKKPNATIDSASESANGNRSGPSSLSTNADRNGAEEKSLNTSLLRPIQTDAPIFYPTEQEFQDPIAYFNKIMPLAAKFGLCKVVAPNTFKPKCMLNDEVRFEVTNQYISRLYKRWGPASRELCAIKAYLASQSVIFSRPPLLEGVEVNLPKLYYLVQTWGGLKEVIEKKRWSKVAEEMSLTKTPKIEIKLDQIYVKYILPYDTMSDDERKDLMITVDKHWNKKHRKMLQRAMKPLHRQKRLLDESESSEEDIDDDIYVSGALLEAEDCISNGRQMNLLTFKKVASKCKEMYLPNNNQNAPTDIEKIYWKMVLLAQDHICVNNASIDTGEEGYGFTKDQRDSYGKHPWNLKVLSQNSGNVLRFLGPVLGVTVPTLHLGMVFSTSCWHRDPHGLPWIEYMHKGPGKIWYGIPDEQSDNFRRAVELLCPTSCQNKSIWLPSDITMIPPDLLLQNNVSMSRVVQEPGQFIVVFPKAYSCSIATGYTESESVYFATNSWLETIDQVFQEVRDSCEPTMFSVEHLLVSAARDLRAEPDVLRLVKVHLGKVIQEELANRKALAAYKIQNQNPQQSKQSRKRPAGAWNVRDQDECEVCQATLYLSKVRGLTDKKRSVCLQHARQLLKTKNRDRDLTSVEIELFFSDTELERVMANINNRI